jgi:PIN domain nuclease of toxin-antitoxin system
MNESVLDASAMLALLNGEQGHETVLALLPNSVIGTVNLAEVVSKLCERGLPLDSAWEAVESIGMETVPFSNDQARRAGALRPLTKQFGLSLGDRCCLALAWDRGADAVTAERHWDGRVEAAAEVRVVRIRGA